MDSPLTETLPFETRCFNSFEDRYIRNKIRWHGTDSKAARVESVASPLRGFILDATIAPRCSRYFLHQIAPNREIARETVTRLNLWKCAVGDGRIAHIDMSASLDSRGIVPDDRVIHVYKKYCSTLNVLVVRNPPNVEVLQAFNRQCTIVVVYDQSECLPGWASRVPWTKTMSTLPFSERVGDRVLHGTFYPLLILADKDRHFAF
jgi:hypothetical protein